jgi:hypothetical protein
MYYACCGNIAAACEKSRTQKTPMQSETSRRLRVEAQNALNQLCGAEFGYGFLSTGAITKAKDWICGRLHLTSLNLSTADAATCHDVTRVCYARLKNRYGYAIRYKR